MGLANDLRTISDQLGTYTDNGYGLKKDSTSITISYDESNTKSVLSIDPKNTSDTVVSNQMTLICERNDNVSVNMLKNIVKNMGYRVYNPALESYTAVDPNLMDLTTAAIESKILQIFIMKKLVPLYRFINTLIFYAKDPGDGSIHLINRHLLQSSIDSQVDIAKANNFSLKICQDMATFIALSDRGLVPANFYHALHNHSGDVLHTNLSGFDLDNVNSDIYLSPVFFSLDRSQQLFVPLRRNVNLLVLNKVNKGGSLKKYVHGLVEKFQIQPLIAVKYPQNIEFYTDKSSEIFPRMNISIFVEQQ